MTKISLKIFCYSKNCLYFCVYKNKDNCIYKSKNKAKDKLPLVKKVKLPTKRKGVAAKVSGTAAGKTLGLSLPVPDRHFLITFFAVEKSNARPARAYNSVAISMLRCEAEEKTILSKNNKTTDKKKRRSHRKFPLVEKVKPTTKEKATENSQKKIEKIGGRGKYGFFEKNHIEKCNGSLDLYGIQKKIHPFLFLRDENLSCHPIWWFYDFYHHQRQKKRNVLLSL